MEAVVISCSLEYWDKLFTKAKRSIAQRAIEYETSSTT